jgi:hypothetical protein
LYQSAKNNGSLGANLRNKAGLQQLNCRNYRLENAARFFLFSTPFRSTGGAMPVFDNEDSKHY